MKRGIFIGISILILLILLGLKISEYDELSVGTIADDDLFTVVDVSETTGTGAGAGGKTTKYKKSSLYTDLADLAIGASGSVHADALPVEAIQRFITDKTAIAFTAADATPDVTEGTTSIVNYRETADTTTITDFDDGADPTADHSQFVEGDWFLLHFRHAAVIDCSDNSNIAGHGNNDYTGAAGEFALVVWDEDQDNWIFWPSEIKTLNFTTLAIPNAESTDAALTAIGQVHLRGDEDRVSFHAGAGGEVAGEVTKSLLDMVVVTFDPSYMYDQESTNRTVPLFTVNSKLYPNGIILDYWAISYNKDPTTEMVAAALSRADAQIGLANATSMDVITTVAGVASEDTDANINSDTAVAAGQFIYIQLNADPTDVEVLCTFTLIFHAVES